MSKITLGEAIDAMLSGKEVRMGNFNYRICRSSYDGHFFQRIDNEIKDARWMKCAIDENEIAKSKIGCHIYNPPTKWTKINWLDALKAASRGQKVAEMSLGHAIILTYNDFFKSKTVEQLENWEYDFFVEIKND